MFLKIYTCIEQMGCTIEIFLSISENYMLNVAFCIHRRLWTQHRVFTLVTLWGCSTLFNQHIVTGFEPVTQVPIQPCVHVNFTLFCGHGNLSLTMCEGNVRSHNARGAMVHWYAIRLLHCGPWFKFRGETTMKNRSRSWLCFPN